MMKQGFIQIGIPLFFMCLMFSNCDNGKTTSIKPVAYNSRYKNKNLDSLLNQVKKSFASGLDFNNELLADSAFVEIFEHSANYDDDVITLLNKNEIDADKAYYCVLAMQSLDVDKYVRLCNIYLTLFDHKKISQGILETAIAPNFLRSRVVLDNYNNPTVAKMLNEYRDDKNISKDFKKTLQDILDGKFST